MNASNPEFSVNPNPPGAATSNYIAIIPAAGVGSRMAAGIPKQYLKIANRSVIEHTLEAFLRHPMITQVCLVVSAEDGYVDNIVSSHPKLRLMRCGGASRKDTVLNALHGIKHEVQPRDWILVHDAARPGINLDLLSKLISALEHHPVGGLLALPVVDTVKRKTAAGLQTIDRSNLWLAQTPQMFHFDDIYQALQQVAEVTDEASAMEACGWQPELIEGHSRNLKITTPADLLLATHYLGKS